MGTSRRDWLESPKEPDGALKKALEVFDGDQSSEPIVVISGRQNKHIAELSVKCQFEIQTDCEEHLRMRSSVDVGNNQAVWNIVERNGTLHRSINAALRSLESLFLAHKLNSLEQMDIGSVARVAM